MIRLHVVDDHIIQRLSLQSIFQILKKALRDRLIHRVQQGGLFVPDQVGIIRNAPRNGVHVFKQGQTAV